MLRKLEDGQVCKYNKTIIWSFWLVAQGSRNKVTTGQTNLPDNVHCPDYWPEKHADSSLVHSLAHPRSKNPQCILYTALQGQTELVGEKNGNPWCTDVSRSLTRFPSRSAHARERDAENPPWWGACVEIPSCRVRMLSNCLPAWQVNVLRTLLRLDSRLDRVLTRQQLTAEKEKRKTT